MSDMTWYMQPNNLKKYTDKIEKMAGGGGARL